MASTTVGPVATVTAGSSRNRAATFLSSTLGKKAVMAVTGIILLGFVLGHLIGNLQVFLGPMALNRYAIFLRELGHGTGIWIARVGLLAAVSLHIWAAAALALRSRAARPTGYSRLQSQESTYASRTMRVSGPIILLFVIYHLLHFTIGTAHPDFRERDIYRNVVSGFQSLPASLVYIAAMLTLGLHLYHGVWSGLQTLGLSNPRFNHLRTAAAAALALLIVVANISMPVAVLLGYLR